MLLDEKNALYQELHKSEMPKESKTFHDISSNLEVRSYDEKHRHRRTAQEICRHYPCPYSECIKSYGYNFLLQ